MPSDICLKSFQLPKNTGDLNVYILLQLFPTHLSFGWQLVVPAVVVVEAVVVLGSNHAVSRTYE